MFRVYLDLGGGSLEVLVDDTFARNNSRATRDATRT
jgi:exopolyphosphatase/pppGpp-phosphohydrolase